MTRPSPPSWTLKFAPAALRDLEKLDPPVCRRVFADIEKLKQNPRPPGVEKLATTERLYRVHVGPGKSYHAIFQIRGDVLLILVVKVGHRKEIYRRLT